MSFRKITTKVHEKDIRKLVREIVGYSISRHNDKYKALLEKIDSQLGVESKDEIFKTLQSIVNLFSHTSKELVDLAPIIGEIESDSETSSKD